MIDAKLARALVAEFHEGQKSRDIVPAARQHVVVRYAPSSLRRLARLRSAVFGNAMPLAAGVNGAHVA